MSAVSATSGVRARARRAVVAAVVAAFGVVGCTGAEAPAGDEQRPGPDGTAVEPGPAARGPNVPPGVTAIVARVDGGLELRPCAGGEARPVRDETGEDLARLVDDLAYGAGEIVVHVVVAGDAIREIRVAVPNEVGCERILPEGELQARGNEPFWGVDVEGGEARFRTPELLDGELYHDGAWREIEGGWRFEAARDHVDGMHYLRLDVRPGRCFDSMSGAWYPFVAGLAVGGADYEGCALEGRSRTAG